MAIDSVGGMRGIVDVERGLVSREIFVSDEIYQQELERVFTRSWLFVGHTSQIPNPNDYFVSRMGEESVLLTRDRQGEVHVLLNSCTHRGMKVIRYDRGSTPVFSCPYHGWSFSTDGRLVSVPGELIGVPQFATAYHGELKKEEWGLVNVPKMHIYKGSVWACWDKDVLDWDDYMGDIKLFLDALLDATDGDPEGRVVIPGVHKWIEPYNWKLGVENFIGDMYHAPTSHRSAQMTGSLKSGSGVYIDLLPQVNYRLETPQASFSFPQGHGVTRSLVPEEWEAGDTLIVDDHPDPVTDAYFKDAYAERARRLGGFGPQRSGSLPSSVFPNVSFGGGSAGITLAVWHPAGPTKTETWRWYFIDKKAPESIRSAWRDESIIGSGPVGRIEKDDMENWVYATEASKGTVARRYPYNYEMGLGHATEHPRLPGAKVVDMPGGEGRKLANEENQRGFYRRWAQLMDAKDWNELREWDRTSR